MAAAATVTRSGPAVAALLTLWDKPPVVNGADFKWGMRTSATWVAECTAEFPENVIMSIWMRK
jgi:hypothetical protein